MIRNPAKLTHRACVYRNEPTKAPNGAKIDNWIECGHPWVGKTNVGGTALIIADQESSTVTISLIAWYSDIFQPNRRIDVDGESYQITRVDPDPDENMPRTSLIIWAVQRKRNPV